MTAQRWTRERRRELTRTALLDAAAEAFARRGFHGASLDEIAEAAGYTRGAISFNFGAKEDLFLAVIERHNAAVLDAYAGVIAGTLLLLHAGWRGGGLLTTALMISFDLVILTGLWGSAT